MNTGFEYPAIRTEELRRHYHMGNSVIRAVDGVSVEARRGEFLALLGSSGSGKSTLLNLIAGLDRPTSGQVMVEGRDLSHMNAEELARFRRQTVGIVFQSFNLIGSMTVLENVELPMRFAEVERGARNERAREALERVGLGERLHHRPGELSGGEQQRASLARALVNQPSVLLADEPTGNLDSHNGQEIMKLLRDINQTLEMTVLMVTHERSLAEQYAERILQMVDGHLCPAELNGTQVSAEQQSTNVEPSRSDA
jgi:ABC-type lipoprotein export system ATPase subunit